MLTTFSAVVKLVIVYICVTGLMSAKIELKMDSIETGLVKRLGKWGDNVYLHCTPSKHLTLCNV